MTTAKFDRLYQSVSNTYSSTSRYNTINAAFTTTGNYFTAAQAKKLISLVSGEANRLLLTKAAYRVLVDRSNYQQFNDLLNTTASRNDLKTFAANMQNGTTTTAKIAMPESTFRDMYTQVELTFGFGAKYSRLTQIFNTETNYFTVAQAKQLIQLVSSEKNRLELAKLS